MVEVSISVVSAFIALGIAVSQFVLPNALALILTGNLSEAHSAVTWSVVSRFFLSTDWPLFLRSDHNASHTVPTKISAVTWAKPISLALIAIAAIVTPLGLYDEIAADSSTQLAQFAYVRDTGVFGFDTPTRSDLGYNFSRTCADKVNGGTLGLELCPGDPNQGNFTQTRITNTTTNETHDFIYYTLPPSISPVLIDLYQSGLLNASSSISSFFDVQFRSWTSWHSEKVKSNGSLLRQEYMFFSSVIQDDKYELVEGLVVDTISGGIGFRNHSVPVDVFEFGSEWAEDVLWMQPESVCVDSNITMSWTGSLAAPDGVTAQIVDRGGFVNIDKVNPASASKAATLYDLFDNGATDADLYSRAYYTAWGINAMSMMYLNLTDSSTDISKISSTLGQKFNVSSDATWQPGNINDFRMDFAVEKIVTKPPYASAWNETSGNYSGYEGGGSFFDDQHVIPNPYNITGDMILDLRDHARGFDVNGSIDFNKLDVEIGYLEGPGTVIHQSDPTNSSSNLTYERPIYICAAATRASIRTIQFRYNSTKTNTLQNLEIISIKDKAYDEEDQKPTWGTEIPWNGTETWNLSSINPLWGLVGSSALNNPNVSTIQSDHFYIPAGPQSIRLDSISGMNDLSGYQDFTPATSGPPALWGEVFGNQNNWTADNRQAAFIKDMMKSPSTASKMLNLMWTEFATQAFVGTRGVHTPKYQPMLSTIQKRDSDNDMRALADGHYPVHILRRQTRYMWIYAIPAGVCGGIVGFVMLLALLALWRGHGTVKRLRFFMFNISTGRVYASLTYPEAGEDRVVGTKEWIELVGHKQIRISGCASDSKTQLLKSDRDSADSSAIRFRHLSDMDSDTELTLT